MPTFDQAVASRLAVGEVLGESSEGVAGPVDLTGAFVAVKGAGVARFIKRAQSGETLVVAALGDSVLEGTTVTNPATDGAIILLAADLATRYDTTVTSENFAASGHTTARSFISGNVGNALAENADLYVIAFGKNDIGSDAVATPPRPGYPIDSSIQQLERMVRLIRSKVPKADIILLAENPYTSGEDASNNIRLQAYNTRMAQVAAVYGCEFVDGYQPFIDLGNFDPYMNDSTHPNTLGHRLLADTMLEHFPLDAPVVAAVAKPPAAGLAPQAAMLNDDSGTQYGWESGASPAVRTFGAWSKVGAGWSGDATTTAGDSVLITVNDGTEVMVQVDTTTENALVADIVVDGVTVQTAVDFTTGKKGTYWVPLAVGLARAAHTVSLVLVSGTLEVTAAAWTVGRTAEDVRSSLVFPVASATTVTLTGSYQNLLGVGQTIRKPHGWGAMSVHVTGMVQPRVLATTTTQRTISLRMTDGGTQFGPLIQFDAPPVAYNAWQPPMALNYAKHGVTADVVLNVDARVTSGDTDKCTINSREFSVTLIRTA